MASLAKEHDGKATGRARFYFSLILVIFCISLLSIPAAIGYRVVDYDTFDYVNRTGDSLVPYGWINYSYGSARNLSYVTIFPAGEAAFCGAFHKSFNQLTASEKLTYNMTVNGSFDGVPLNFSVRYMLRNNRNTDPFGNFSTYAKIAPSTNQAGAGVIPDPFPQMRYYGNFSGLPKLYAYNNMSKPAFYSLAFANFDYVSFQVDYNMTQFPPPLSAGYKQSASFNVWVNGVLVDANEPGDMFTTGSSLAQRFNATYILGTPSSECYVIDDLATIVYDPGEAPISATAVLSGWGALPNQMPYYEIIQADELGFLGNTVAPGNHSMVFTALNVVDPEADTVYWGVSCGAYDAEIFQERFTDDISAISARYGITSNASIVYYATNRTGIKLSESMNSTNQKFISNFADTLLGDNTYHGYSLDLDFQPGSSNITRLDLVDFNNNPVYSLCMGRCNLTGRLSYSIGCTGISQTLDTAYNPAAPVSLRLVVNNLDDSISFSIKQTSNLSIETAFYSPKTNIAFGIPIKNIQVYAPVSCTSTIANNTGEIIGWISARQLEIPASLSLYSSVFQKNCSSAGKLGTYTAAVFFTDNQHSGNWAYYTDYPYIVTSLPINSDIDNAFADDALGEYFSGLFMGSLMLQYLFVVFVLAIVTIGCVYLGSLMGGSGMLGFMAAVVFDVIAVFMFSLMGLIPLWVPIMVFIIAALLVTFIIMKGLNVGTGD
jgi:hypothetical protein